MKLEPDVGNRAVNALREFGDWARGTFLDDIASASTTDSPFIDESDDELDLDLDSLRDELLDEYPNGYDWTGISNVMLIHSPNQVVYVSIDNPNHTKFARDILPRDAWPSYVNGFPKLVGDAFQIPMDLGIIDSPQHVAPVLWWEDISWPQFVGPEAMSALFKIMDHWDALQVWASIAEAEYRARRTFDARVGDWSDRVLQGANAPTNGGETAS
ncbi:MAG: hypothetical protein OXI33_10010 [Chloroflexota bacterium]|nr:hypothetical protein [Chloroflexota bacterium]